MERTNRLVGCLIVLLPALATTVAMAADLTIPKTFVPGTPATAADVNANFSATSTAVNSKQNRVTGSCSVGQAIRAINADGTVVCETGLATTASLLNYMPVGPQTNVPQTLVNLGGWTTCYTELYNATGASATILTACNKANLMLACRQTGSDAYALLAQAPRTDVTFVTPVDATTVHVANGTGWYFNNGQAWGFIKPGDVISRSSCDTQTGTAPEQRLCWHLGTTTPGVLFGGYRCGAATSLNSSTAWERVLLHRD
jgi:hypothetical protein